jgi:hypothetical protein
MSCSLQTAEDLAADKVELSAAAYPPIGGNFKIDFK